VEPRERYDEIADDLLAQNDDISLSQMMGMPCIKKGSKMIGGFSKGAMVFKLPNVDVREGALALDGAHLFDPSGEGKPFREWVVVPAAHADRWPKLAAASLAGGLPPGETRLSPA
jgi:hypothetical protein